MAQHRRETRRHQRELRRLSEPDAAVTTPDGAPAAGTGGAPAPATESARLEVQDLRTWFRTARGIVHAVDGVSFALERGKTLGVVGESGSGKTVLSRSVMRLLPKSTTLHPTGKVFF